jgi:hypothetical protein
MYYDENASRVCILEKLILFTFIFATQTGYLYRVTVAYGIQLKLYHFLSPVGLILLAVYMLSTTSEIELSYQAITFLALQFLVFSTILLVESRGSQVDEILAQLAAFLFLCGLAVLIRRFPNKYVIHYLLLSGLPVIVADLAAIFSFMTPGTTAAHILPGTTYGGLGINALFGEHGIVVSITIVAALHEFSKASRLRRISLSAILVSAVATLYFSHSRSSIIAAVTALAVFMISRSRLSILRRSATVAGALTPLAGGFLMIQFRRRTLLSRLENLRVAFDVFADNALTGIGWDTFRSVHSSQGLHFTPGQYFVAGGLVSGFAYLSLLVYPIICAIRGLLNSSGSRFKLIGTFFAMFTAVCIEIALYPSAPNIPVLSVGMFLCVYSVSGRH